MSTLDLLLESLRRRASSASNRVDFGPGAIVKPATQRVVDDAQQRLEFALPAFYRRLLLEIGNGGFGPGHGILGLPPGGYEDATLGDLLAHYLTSIAFEHAEWRQPRGLLPLCVWDSDVWLHVDCLHEKARIVTATTTQDGYRYYGSFESLESCLSLWVTDDSFSNRVRKVVGTREGTNPFTGKPCVYDVTALCGDILDLSARCA